jgi:hypothetical protein
METEELLMVAIEYKENWGRVLADRVRSGATGPVPVPHPDDVNIDYATGEVRIDGPVDEKAKLTMAATIATFVNIASP